MLIEIGEVEAIFRYPVKSMGANQNHAGIYGAVTRIGRLAVGQTVLLRAGIQFNRE